VLYSHNWWSVSIANKLRLLEPVSVLTTKYVIQNIHLPVSSSSCSCFPFQDFAHCNLCVASFVLVIIFIVKLLALICELGKGREWGKVMVSYYKACKHQVMEQ
jgi:formate-dependent nitrite reductase membrane component NrfD